MSQQFANTQPTGFVNNIRNVAIVGASGNQGSHIVTELLTTGKHNITAITREDSSSTFAEGVITKKINYASQDSIVAALQGQDALVITMSVTAPKEQVKQLIEAAAAAGVKWIVPNEWGTSPIKSPIPDHLLTTHQASTAATNHSAKIHS